MPSAPLPLFCPACDYDLRGHAAAHPGADTVRCPECGEGVSTRHITLRGWNEFPDHAIGQRLVSLSNAFSFSFILLATSSLKVTSLLWDFAWLATIAVGSYWFLRRHPRRIHELVLRPDGVSLHVVAEPLRLDPWENGDHLTLTTRAGLTSLRLRRSLDAPRPMPEVCRLFTRLKPERIDELRLVLALWSGVSAGLPNARPRLPRRCQSCLALASSHELACSRCARSLAEAPFVLEPCRSMPMPTGAFAMELAAEFLPTVLFIGFILTAVARGAGVLAFCGAMALGVLIQLAFRLNLFRKGRAELRFGPQGYQRAHPAAALRLTPWAPGSWLQFSPHLAGSMYVRILDSSRRSDNRKPLGTGPAFYLSISDARWLSDQIRRWAKALDANADA